MRVRPLLTALGLNAVPAVGWFFGDWSAGTTLLVYWIETLLSTLLVGVRIMLHRRIARSQGHWDYEAPKGHESHTSHRSSEPCTYLAAFLTPVLLFTFAHGIFLAALGGIMIAKDLTPEARIDSGSLLAGVIGILVFQCVDFLADLIWLRGRPFRWIERLGQQSFSRVAVIHLTIIGGMFAVMLTGAHRDFFGVFIFLKTMLNLSLVVPQYKPETPPAWLAKMMDSNLANRLKMPEHKGKDFAQYWKQTDDQEAARLARNEKPIEAAAKRQK